VFVGWSIQARPSRLTPRHDVTTAPAASSDATTHAAGNNVIGNVANRHRVRFCRAFNCRILYGLYLPTVFISQQSYLLLFGIPSPTHSFFPGLKPSFSANPSHCSGAALPFFYLNIYYVDSPDCLLFSFFLFLHFLVVGSVRYIKLTHVGFRAHVKIASRIVSYRSVLSPLSIQGLATPWTYFSLFVSVLCHSD